MIERLLRRFVPFKEIGWYEIRERFTRFQLVKMPWFNLYLHKLYAPQLHPHCHDHPWSFVTLLLKGGYWEYQEPGDSQWRKPGSILVRPATYRHSVTTIDGPKLNRQGVHVSWSLVLTAAKSREWGFKETCHVA